MEFMNFTKLAFESAFLEGHFSWTKHVLQRLVERGIPQEEVIRILNEWDVLETDWDRKPYPTRLFMGWQDSKPIHVAAAWDEQGSWVYIITVYEPDADHFVPPDFRLRRTT
jgi:hypothetical protein